MSFRSRQLADWAHSAKWNQSFGLNSATIWCKSQDPPMWLPLNLSCSQVSNQHMLIKEKKVPLNRSILNESMWKTGWVWVIWHHAVFNLSRHNHTASQTQASSQTPSEMPNRPQTVILFECRLPLLSLDWIRFGRSSHHKLPLRSNNLDCNVFLRREGKDNRQRNKVVGFLLDLNKLQMQNKATLS